MTPAASFAVARPEKPYPGLRPFEDSEWSIFFGREQMIEDVIERLAQNRLVLIHGASGSGKSSLVRAGVMPKLARQYRRHGAPWLTCAMRPAGGPLWNLASELAELEGKGADVERIGAIVNAFNRRDASFASVVGGIEALATQSLCILVDQFEELFRFEKETSREEAELFVDLIARAARPADGSNVHVVVTMRSEFLGQCARFSGLAEVINKTQYLVPRMDDEALLRATRRPAQLFKGFVGEDLAYRLIARVRGREDELPLLQHGLMLMWDEAAAKPADDGRIVLGGTMVEQAGGLAELLSNHADRIMDAAAPDPRRARIVERVFRALTDVNAEGAAIRRPQRAADLAAVAGTTLGELTPILDAFRAPDVSFLTPYAPAPIDETSIIDISHEALIRCWRRIGSGQDGWLKQELDDGLAWRSLLSEAEAYAKNPERVLSPAATEDRGGLVGARNEAWARRYGGGWPIVDKLLEASRKSAARTRRRARIVMASLAGLAIGGIALAFATHFANEKYLEQREAASKLFDELANIGNSNEVRKKVFAPLFTQTEASAERGDVMALSHLGYLYYNGFGVQQDYGKARQWYEKAVAAGDTRAMRLLAGLYENGEGVAQDYSKARLWYERAAGAGDVSAMQSVATEYENGTGGPVDYGKARAWYEKAAAAGDVQSMSSVGDFYKNGNGVDIDFGKAREWYAKAAAAGNTDAMELIGDLYKDGGESLPKDFDKALEWYERAFAAGKTQTASDVGQLYQNGEGWPTDYAQARIWYGKAVAAGNTDAMKSIGDLYKSGGKGLPKDVKKAVEWYQKALDAGSTTVAYDVGQIFENGDGVTKDYAKAREWYEKAAATGDATAMDYIGDFYRDGKGTAVDYVKARQWYEKAAATNYTDAMLSLADLYKDGQGTPKNFDKARQWYEKAAASGDTNAMVAIGDLYYDGDGTTKDYGKAREWYVKAAAADSTRAMVDLGDLYENGKGVPQDYAEARRWYRKAADNDDADAMRALGDFYRDGKGVPKNQAKAQEWYGKAEDAEAKAKADGEPENNDKPDKSDDRE